MSNWTVAEFDIPLDNHGLSGEEFAHMLPGRSIGAIDVVRNAIHSYHTDERLISALSKMMIRRLDERSSSVVCPRCGVSVRDP